MAVSQFGFFYFLPNPASYSFYKPWEMSAPSRKRDRPPKQHKLHSQNEKMQNEKKKKIDELEKTLQNLNNQYEDLKKRGDGRGYNFSENETRMILCSLVVQCKKQIEKNSRKAETQILWSLWKTWLFWIRLVSSTMSDFERSSWQMPQSLQWNDQEWREFKWNNFRLAGR